ncbi:uncharacterized protein NEMAJ01_1533 [Nematocida major]|uniref:uncharacterized protein n=1 Tax=Nematocida major TaxID=1912982 RepID=UPI00200786F6|nr:uncharacterized protein NEMAJ01_1533 [Nematocida major]KAH9386637.1 hypothetical protein NEMAJ01_1533 [Nematocida major]
MEIWKKTVLAIMSVSIVLGIGAYSYISYEGGKSAKKEARKSAESPKPHANKPVKPLRKALSHKNAPSMPTLIEEAEAEEKCVCTAEDCSATVLVLSGASPELLESKDGSSSAEESSEAEPSEKSAAEFFEETSPRKSCILIPCNFDKDGESEFSTGNVEWKYHRENLGNMGKPSKLMHGPDNGSFGVVRNPRHMQPNLLDHETIEEESSHSGAADTEKEANSNKAADVEYSAPIDEKTKNDPVPEKGSSPGPSSNTVIEGEGKGEYNNAVGAKNPTIPDEKEKIGKSDDVLLPNHLSVLQPENSEQKPEPKQSDLKESSGTSDLSGAMEPEKAVSAQNENIQSLNENPAVEKSKESEEDKKPFSIDEEGTPLPVPMPLQDPEPSLPSADSSSVEAPSDLWAHLSNRIAPIIPQANSSPTVQHPTHEALPNASTEGEAASTSFLGGQSKSLNVQVPDEKHKMRPAEESTAGTPSPSGSNESQGLEKTSTPSKDSDPANTEEPAPANPEIVAPRKSETLEISGANDPVPTKQKEPAPAKPEVKQLEDPKIPEPSDSSHAISSTQKEPASGEKKDPKPANEATSLEVPAVVGPNDVVPAEPKNAAPSAPAPAKEISPTPAISTPSEPTNPAITETKEVAPPKPVYVVPFVSDDGSSDKTDPKDLDMAKKDVGLFSNSDDLPPVVHDPKNVEPAVPAKPAVDPTPADPKNLRPAVPPKPMVNPASAKPKPADPMNLRPAVPSEQTGPSPVESTPNKEISI